MSKDVLREGKENHSKSCTSPQEGGERNNSEILAAPIATSRGLLQRSRASAELERVDLWEASQRSKRPGVTVPGIKFGIKVLGCFHTDWIKILSVDCTGLLSHIRG